jgi:hypothetical protein
MRHPPSRPKKRLMRTGMKRTRTTRRRMKRTTTMKKRRKPWCRLLPRALLPP